MMFVKFWGVGGVQLPTIRVAFSEGIRLASRLEPTRPYSSWMQEPASAGLAQIS